MERKEKEDERNLQAKNKVQKQCLKCCSQSPTGKSDCRLGNSKKFL